LDKLKVLQLFVTAADQGSFNAASKHRGTSPSTISKAISRLETDLGIQLFYRNTRKLSLTQAGETYSETVRQLLNALEFSEQQLKNDNDDAIGHLKISVPVSYGRLYIRPWMKRFHDFYPNISFELTYSDQYTDMVKQGIDICIRSGTVQDNRLACRRLSPIDFITCASPGYLQKQGIHCSETNSVSINGPEQFSQHRWIQFRFGQTGRLLPIKYAHQESLIAYQPTDNIIVDDGEAMAELCADDFGLSQMPHFIARNWLNDGSIVRVSPVIQPPNFGVYALYPKRHYLPKRVRVFIDFLVEQLASDGEYSDSTWATH